MEDEDSSRSREWITQKLSDWKGILMIQPNIDTPGGSFAATAPNASAKVPPNC
jgi:hypothetical protein